MNNTDIKTSKLINVLLEKTSSASLLNLPSSSVPVFMCPVFENLFPDLTSNQQFTS